MAKKLKTFPLPPKGVRIDWESLIDGSVYELTKGVDFSSEIETARSSAFQAARNRGLKVRTSIRDEYTLVVQFYGG